MIDGWIDSTRSSPKRELCHSERSEESLVAKGEILRFTQNDSHQTTLDCVVGWRFWGEAEKMVNGGGEGGVKQVYDTIGRRP